MKCNDKLKAHNGWNRCSECLGEWHPAIDRPFCFPKTDKKHEVQRQRVTVKVNKVREEEQAWSLQEIKDTKLDRRLIV